MPHKPIDFFILGAPKCATTALASYLDHHSQVEISKPKEPHFFDADYTEDKQAYEARYFASSNNVIARGEATPSYLMVPWVAKRIAQYNPRAKLIVCLRDPVGRAFSSWWMLYSRGLEKLDFAEAIRAEHDQGSIFDKPAAQELWTAQIDAIAKGEELPVRTYLAAGDYAKHLARYMDLFPREQIHVVLSSRLKSQRQCELEQAYRFLSVDPPSAPLQGEGPVNAAYGANAGKVLRLAQKLNLMQFRSIVPNALREPIKARLSKMGKAPHIDDQTRSYLKGHFEGGISALEAQWQLDLAEWRK